MSKHDVCLLSMPFPNLNQPSMALSLLKAALSHTGLAVEVLYPCLWFAEEIGLDVYAAICDSRQEFLLGEWIFAGAAFPEFQPDDDAYLDRVLAAPVTRAVLGRANLDQEPKQWLLHVRRAADGFVGRVAERVLASGPAIVGCTSTFAQQCASLAVLRKVKELAPGVITLLGGANCEGPMGVATRKCFGWVDFVVSGEAEVLFPELCQRLIASGPGAPVRDLHGVIGADHSAVRFGSEAPRTSVEPMDQSPVPDFDDYFAALHASPLARFIVPALPVETSRGCWWGEKHHCTFCGLNGNGMRFRSKQPARVSDELALLAQRHGIRKFNVVDNIMDLRYVTELLPRLPVDPPYTLFYETKSNLKRDQLEAIAQAGIRRLQPGIESMHDSILQLMDKGTTALQNVQLLKWARELGVFITWNFLWDFPGERDEWYAEMASWLPRVAHLQPPGVDRIQFHRFSPYHQRSEEFGLTLEPGFAYSYVYPVAASQLRQLAYYFENPVRRPARQELEQRPGLLAALRAIGQWLAAWGQGGTTPKATRPLLLMRDQGTHITIQDTRACGSGEQTLHGLECVVYRACDGIQSLSSLVAAVQRQHDQPVTAAAVHDVVDSLDARKLVLRGGNKVLALALREVARIPDSIAEFPGGYMDVDAWRAAASSLSS